MHQGIASLAFGGEDRNMPVERLTPERRRELTRSALLAAAAEVFPRRGFRGASLDEIAEAAGFSKGAVYSNFASKEDLFLAVVQQRQETMLHEFFAAAQDSEPAARLGAITDAYRRLTPTREEWVLWEEFLLYALRSPEQKKKLDQDQKAAFAALVAMVAQQWEEAGVEPPIPVPALARLYLAVFDGLARQRALDPADVPDDLFATLVSFIGDAVEALGTRRDSKRKRRTTE